MRFELMTSSLPRKCSTPELQQLLVLERETRLELATYSLEGYRSTNWATPAYLIQGFRFNVPDLTFENWTSNIEPASGGNRIRTCEDISQQIYSLSQLAALVFPQLGICLGVSAGVP